MALRWCSVADVTIRVQALQVDPTWGAVWYRAPFTQASAENLEAMLFFVYNDGLRYMRYLPDAPDFWGNVVYWSGVPGNSTGPSTLIRSFGGGEWIDATLGFQIAIDEGGNHTVTCSDDVGGIGLVDTWTTRDTLGNREINVGDLIGRLYFSIGGWGSPSVGQETTRIGGPTATVWRMAQESVWNEFEGDYENNVWQVTTEYSPVRTAEEGFGGTPQTVASAARAWAAWLAYVQAGGDASDYRANGDLFGDGTVGGAGPPARFAPFLVDAEGCIYGKAQAGDTAMGLLEMTFDRYNPSAGVPNLSIAHHPVSNALLVTDAGLASDGSVGYWKVQRKGG